MIVIPPNANTIKQPGIEARDLQRIGAVAEKVGERREELRGLEQAAEGDHREDEQHRREHDPGRNRIGVPVVGLRPPIFLDQHLEAIGKAVEQAEPDELHLRERNPHVGTVRADPVRHHRGLLALDPGEHRAERHQHGERVADVHGVDDEVLDHASASAPESAHDSRSCRPPAIARGRASSRALALPRSLMRVPFLPPPGPRTTPRHRSPRALWRSRVRTR